MKYKEEIEIWKSDDPRIHKLCVSTMEQIKRKDNIVRGEWYDKGSLSCRCSNCGCKNNKETNYCPHCGADMRGEEDDDK